MRPGMRKFLGITLVIPALLLVGICEQSSQGDEPGRFGRLFRLGGNNNSAPPSPPVSAPPSTSSVPGLLPPPSTLSTPTSEGSASPRIMPQPRVSRAATESDPILTRIGIGRTSDGSQFCDFLQVYADGTVLDGGGVHHVGRETLNPLIDVIQGGEAFRLHGHCGGPPADWIEQVHIVVYERSLGRLKANSFSYSGNPQGCDHSVKHLQQAIEALQTKISGPPMVAPAGATPTVSAPEAPAPAPSTGRTIPLTPLN